MLWWALECVMNVVLAVGWSEVDLVVVVQEQVRLAVG